MHRTWAIIERELRRFRRSPMLIVMSLVMPFIVLGYAFGGQVKHLKVGLVDQDHGVPAVRLHELSNAVAANANTFTPLMYNDLGAALGDLRNGRLNGVLAIPPDFSRRQLTGDAPRVALIEELAAHLKPIVVFPREDVEAMPDEQYIRNVVDILFRTRGDEGKPAPQTVGATA